MALEIPDYQGLGYDWLELQRLHFRALTHKTGLQLALLASRLSLFFFFFKQNCTMGTFIVGVLGHGFAHAEPRLYQALLYLVL